MYIFKDYWILEDFANDLIVRISSILNYRKISYIYPDLEIAHKQYTSLISSICNFLYLFIQGIVIFCVVDLEMKTDLA